MYFYLSWRLLCIGWSCILQWIRKCSYCWRDHFQFRATYFFNDWLDPVEWKFRYFWTYSCSFARFCAACIQLFHLLERILRWKLHCSVTFRLLLFLAWLLLYILGFFLAAAPPWTFPEPSFARGLRHSSHFFGLQKSLLWRENLLKTGMGLRLQRLSRCKLPDPCRLHKSEWFRIPRKRLRVSLRAHISAILTCHSPHNMRKFLASTLYD